VDAARESPQALPLVNELDAALSAQEGLDRDLRLVLLAIGAQCAMALVANQRRPGFNALGKGAAVGNDTVGGHLETIRGLVPALVPVEADPRQGQLDAEFAGREDWANGLTVLQGLFSGDEITFRVAREALGGRLRASERKPPSENRGGPRCGVSPATYRRRLAQVEQVPEAARLIWPGRA
jgi:hypothetical protein